MTYKQMTREIDAITEQIHFLYSIRDKFFKGEKYKTHMIGDIVNNLCAYKNYLRFTKEYEHSPSKKIIEYLNCGELPPLTDASQKNVFGLQSIE